MKDLINYVASLFCAFGVGVMIASVFALPKMFGIMFESVDAERTPPALKAFFSSENGQVFGWVVMVSISMLIGLRVFLWLKKFNAPAEESTVSEEL